ncbi:MAG TPA: class I SAM-dependent methyltransferase [Oscillospiraceae bacterium]|nr:class I SAM-dependent methyltransferase [Oscillospiraceae bacterium]
MIKLTDIDNGKEFDWGKISSDYAKYRDLYPKEFYQKLVDLGLCVSGQKVLDLGTGTGVLPRNMYQFGASFIGTDISENQIKEAERLSREQNMEIRYLVCPAEKVDFPENTFDVVTACQCFMYFDKSVLLPNLARMLKPNGRLAVLFLSWLSCESNIAMQSENLILKYNPSWTGGGMKRFPPETPQWSKELFDVEYNLAFDMNVPFTRESWNGRIRACRGIGASLPQEQIEAFNREHMQLLNQIAPETFDILHYATMLILKVKK